MQLIRTVEVWIVWIVWIRIWDPETDRKSEANEDRIGSKKAVIGKEVAINEETIIREEVTVKITVKLVKSATMKTHIPTLKTSRTTAMKASAAKTSVTNTDRRHREKTREYSSKEKLQSHICSFLAPPL
jgi:hypothetical protein